MKVKGIITYSEKRGAYILFRIGLKKWVYWYAPTAESSQYVGSKICGNIHTKIKNGQVVYIFTERPQITEPLVCEWNDFIIKFLTLCGKRKIVNILRRKHLKDPLEIWKFYFAGMIDFYTALSCFRYSLPLREVLFKAAVKHFSYELYQTNRRITCKQLVTKIKKFFLRSYGINVDTSIIMKHIGEDPSQFYAIKEGEWVYPVDIYIKKTRVLSAFKKQTSPPDTYVDASILQVLKLLENYKYLVITGSAGTGKTTLLKNIYSQYHGVVKNVALTGKAATRLTEGETLHSWLLQKEKYCDLLIIDEASMLTWELLFEVINTYESSNTKIIFSGDPAQLPPVSGENVFSTILEVLPKIELKNVYRGEMKIVERTVSKDEVLHILKDTIKKMLNAGITDFQVISPYYDGHIGIDRINLFLKETFKEFKKVIITKNLRDLHGKLLVTNGTIGDEVSRHNGYVMINTQLLKNISVPERYVKEAHCISVHKAQGSEWDYVICVLPIEVSQEIELTATTRAKRKTLLLRVFD